MKSLKTHLKEKSYGPQDTGLGKDEWKSKLKQHHPDVEFTNVSGKDYEAHEAHIPWGKDKRRVGVWTNREKGGPHHSMDFARLATKESVEISEQSDGFLKSAAAYHEGEAKKAGKSGPTKLEGIHNMAAHHFKQALKAPTMDKRDYHYYKATSYADDAEEHEREHYKEETVNEISQKTAASYLTKVTQQQLKKIGYQPNMYDKLPKNRQQGVSNAWKRLEVKESDQDINELKSSTLKSYLKSNLRKTVEKDGQPNPPLFKLKARAKGMETAISKLMKREAFEEAVRPIHPAVKALASMPHTEYKATVTFHDGTSKNITMKGTGGTRGALGHIQNHYANRGMKVKDVRFTSIKDKEPVKEEAMNEAKNAHFVHIHDSEDVLSAHNMIHSEAEAIAKKNNGKIIRVSNVKTNIEYPGGHSTTITTKKEDDTVKSHINHIYEQTMAHSIGDQVICTKTNRFATVTGIENNKYTVAYGDGSTETGDASWWNPVRKSNESKSFSQIRNEARAVWDKPNPKAEAGKSKKLSPEQIAKAKARAKAAGRSYPNMVDNIWAARNEETELDEVLGPENDIGTKALTRKLMKLTPGQEVNVKHVQEEEDKPLNKPFLTPGGPKKRAVYVKDPSTGNVKKVNFGDTTGLTIKTSDPERRKAYRARHNCDNPGPKTKANYWSCKAWSANTVKKGLGK